MNAMQFKLENPPANDKAGFLNHLKIAANYLRLGLAGIPPGSGQVDKDSLQSAMYALDDMIDTFAQERVVFLYHGGDVGLV